MDNLNFSSVPLELSRGMSVITTGKGVSNVPLSDKDEAESWLDLFSHNSAQLANLVDQYRSKIRSMHKSSHIVPFLTKRNEIWNRGFLNKGWTKLEDLVPRLLKAIYKKALEASEMDHKALLDRCLKSISNLTKIYSFQRPPRFDINHPHKYFDEGFHPINPTKQRRSDSRGFGVDSYTQTNYMPEELPSLQDFMSQLASGLKRVKDIVDPMYAELDRELNDRPKTLQAA